MPWIWCESIKKRIFLLNFRYITIIKGHTKRFYISDISYFVALSSNINFHQLSGYYFLLLLWIMCRMKLLLYLLNIRSEIKFYNLKSNVLQGLEVNVLFSLLLTYSMVQSLLWEASWLAVSQEIPRISRNPKVHYRTHKRPPNFSILGQPNPVHTPTSHLLEICPNIIHPSTPRSPQWSPSPGFPTKDIYTPSPHPYAPHAQPISFFSILSPAQYWARSTNHLAPLFPTEEITDFMMLKITLFPIKYLLIPGSDERTMCSLLGTEWILYAMCTVLLLEMICIGP